MKTLTTIKTLSPNSDWPIISDFVTAMRDESLLPDRAAVDDVIQVLFDQGGIVELHKNETLVGFIGYLLGDPAEDYADKKVGFMYIMGIAKRYRLTRMGTTCSTTCCRIGISPPALGAYFRRSVLRHRDWLTQSRLREQRSVAR